MEPENIETQEQPTEQLHRVLFKDGTERVVTNTEFKTLNDEDWIQWHEIRPRFIIVPSLDAATETVRFTVHDLEQPSEMHFSTRAGAQSYIDQQEVQPNA